MKHYRKLRNRVNNVVRKERDIDDGEIWMDVSENMMEKRLWQEESMLDTISDS